MPKDEVLSDALSLLPLFDSLTDDSHNRFTEQDIKDAMNMYQENYVTYSRAEIERVSGISVPLNKRNRRSRKEHLQADEWKNEKGRPIANICRENRERALKYMRENGEIKGRPNKAKIVEEWRKVHPDGKKVDCIHDTGLSKPTVYRWWGKD